jgi:hypothetical protein
MFKYKYKTTGKITVVCILIEIKIYKIVILPLKFLKIMFL